MIRRLLSALSVTTIIVLLCLGIGQSVQATTLNFEPTQNPGINSYVNSQSKLNTSTGLGSISPTVVALNLINTALSLLGTLSLVLLVYGGFLWVWARGNSEQIDRAKEIIRGTIIGLIIVFASLGIVQYVFFTVGNITGATTANTTTS